MAEQLTPWLQEQVQRKQVTLLDGRYRPEILGDMVLVFAATNDRILNRQIAADARERGTLCNMATDPELGDLILPSIYERGPLCIAFSTGGLSPGVARVIREQFDKDFGPEWIAALDLLGRLRMAIKKLGLPESENRQIFKELAALSIQELIASRNEEAMIQAVAAVCRPHLDTEQIRDLWEDSWKQLS